MKQDYKSLRKEYPEIVGLEQMRMICGIAKRSAKYLLDHGIVPSENTGKKTRQYKIRLDDIITYLQVREKWGSQIPKGAVNGRQRKVERSTRNSFSLIITPGMEKEIADYFNYIYADYPEKLSISDVSEMTGFSKEAIRRRIHRGDLKSLKEKNQYLIPKCWLIDFTISPAFLESNTGSNTFRKILGGFELWKTQKQKL